MRCRGELGGTRVGGVIRRVVACLAGVGALTGGEVVAATTFRATEESRVLIRGRATIGGWECESNEIIAAVEPGPRLAALAAEVSRGPSRLAAAVARWAERDEGAAPHAHVSIPVASLRAAKPGMRADLLRALKHEDAPLIVFLLGGIDDMQVLPPEPGELGRYRLEATGELVLAGVSRRIGIAAEVVQETPTRFRVRATKAVRMVDFDITPPTALFGLIRVDPVVEVSFDLVLEAMGGG